MKTLRSSRGVAALALVLAGAAGGCSVNSPVQTQHTMAPSDGINVDLDGVQVRNLALVAGAKGGPATVIGGVDNRTGEDLEVTLSVDGAEVSTTADHGTLTRLSTPEQKLTLETIPGAPGDLVDVELGMGPDSTPVRVPVLDPAGYYEDVAPKGWTPTPSPTTEGGEHGEGEHGDGHGEEGGSGH